MTCERPVEFALKLRAPEWAAGEIYVSVNGEAQTHVVEQSGFLVLRRTWHGDEVRIAIPKALSACPLPDERETIAFLDGPVVLAGICDGERVLRGDIDGPRSMLAPDSEREWDQWKGGYRAVGQPTGLRFRPLYEVVDEPYALYFPVRAASPE
jgi:hypothetical protein